MVISAVCGSYSDSSVLSNHHSNIQNKNKLYRLITKLAYITYVRFHTNCV